MVNVVNRDDIIDTLAENNTQLDLNGDGKKDLLMRNEKQIRIKHADPNKAQNATIFTRLYRTPTFDSPNDVAEAMKRGGRLSVAGSTFKLWDNTVAPQ